MSQDDSSLPEAPAAAVQFSTKLPFSHLPPYDPLFAERVPLLQAFTVALGTYHRLRAQAGAAAQPGAADPFEPFSAAECGVFTGNSLVACASLARDMGVPFHLVGLDTFEGLPPLSETDLSLSPADASYVKERAFTNTSTGKVRKRLRLAGIAEDAVDLQVGLFSESLPRLPERRYHFVNIDCDLYEPHLECLEYFYPRLVPGGILFFDDYHSVTYPMARKAVDDFMRGRPEQLVHLRFGEDGPNLTKAYIVKY